VPRCCKRCSLILHSLPWWVAAVWPGEVQGWQWMEQDIGKKVWGERCMVYGKWQVTCVAYCLTLVNVIVWTSSKVVLAPVPSCYNCSGIPLQPEPNYCNGIYHTNIKTVANWPVLPPKTWPLILISITPMKYLSSDCNMTWSVSSLYSSSSCLIRQSRIRHQTNIGCGLIENPSIAIEICPSFTATQGVSGGCQIWKWEMTKRIVLFNLHTYHVNIWLEMKYLIAAKCVRMVKLGLQSGYNPAEKPCVNVEPWSQTCASYLVHVAWWFLTQTVTSWWVVPCIVAR